MSTSVETERYGAAVVVALAGEVDRFTAGVVRRTLARAEESGRDVVLDLSRTLFIDSTALGVVAAAAKRSRSSGRKLVLVVSDRNLRRTLRVTAIDLLCSVFASRAEALDALAETAGDGRASRPAP